MSKDLKFPLMCYDVIFKSVFLNNENILAKMISDITNIDYKILENNITLEANELPISKKNEKAKRCDFVVRLDKDYILNLELNRQSHTGLIVRNLSYVFNLFSTHTKVGDEYNENLVVMQININCFDNQNGKALSRYHIKEDYDDDIYSNNLVLYTLNVVNCKELYYNYSNKKVPKYIRWGALIYCDNISKIPIITKGIMTYEERNIIMDKLNKLQNDKEIMTELEALEWEEWERNTIYSDGIKKGIEEGIKQGIKQGIEQGIEQGTKEKTIEIIKSMLKKELDINLISEITNRSIEEINKIKESL